MGTRTIGTDIKLTGEKEFNDGMKAMNSNLKVLKSDMAAVSSEFADNADSMEALTAKQKVLQQSVDQHQANVTSIRQMLEQLPSETLREMLDKELHTEPVNGDAIRLIRSILREREKDIAVVMTPELEKAWEKYQRDTDKIWASSRRSRKIRSWTMRAVAAAAMLVLLLIPVVPQEAGAESLWDALVRWTSEIVEFFGPGDNEHRIVEYEFKTDNPGLQQVYDAVVELGVTEPVVPMWLPDGYELVEFEIDDSPAVTRVHARFTCQKENIILSVDICNAEVSRTYQKDESPVDSYEHSGIAHQIFQNYENTTVVWSRNNIECHLVVNCQVDILHEILKSIYIGG